MEFEQIAGIKDEKIDKKNSKAVKKMGEVLKDGELSDAAKVQMISMICKTVNLEIELLKAKKEIKEWEEMEENH